MNYYTRLLFALSLLLLANPGNAAPPPAPAAPHLPQLTIYAAKGPADACGPGCDRWIAIEGEIKRGAAARVERFFRERKDVNRPIYFSSPGGDMRDALAIGRLLRRRKAVGRVGRTVVDACPGTQADDACMMIKSGREEVDATVTTRGAVCGSACTFLLFGAVTREVAPDAAVAVHGPKVRIDFPPEVSQKRREQAFAKAYGDADHLGTAYVEEMGISRELMALAESISHTSFHVLTRQELYRFGVDRREMAETAWTLEKGARPSVGKVAEVRNGDGFQKFNWQVSCDSKAQARLLLADDAKDTNGTRATAMVAGAAKPAQFTRIPVRVGTTEIWTAVITTDAMKDLVAVPHLGIGQSTVMPDGTTTSFHFEIETRGLEAAWTELAATCATSQVLTTPPKWSLSFPTLLPSAQSPTVISPTRIVPAPTSPTAVSPTSRPAAPNWPTPSARVNGDAGTGSVK